MSSTTTSGADLLRHRRFDGRESVWKDNRRRHNEKHPTWDVLHKHPHDYKVVIVGDATMSSYEITYPGGSVEHWNEEPGAV
jgi:uncharacterized protein with von Willebrand factor type A (vWA) domain